jgi:hypothetical protein
MGALSRGQGDSAMGRLHKRNPASRKLDRVLTGEIYVAII